MRGNMDANLLLVPPGLQRTLQEKVLEDHAKAKRELWATGVFLEDDSWTTAAPKKADRCDPLLVLAQFALAQIFATSSLVLLGFSRESSTTFGPAENFRGGWPLVILGFPPAGNMCTRLVTGCRLNKSTLSQGALLLFFGYTARQQLHLQVKVHRWNKLVKCKLWKQC